MMVVFVTENRVIWTTEGAKLGGTSRVRAAAKKGNE